jgi:hypothetical protein
MSDDVSKAKSKLHRAKENQQVRAAAFWQRTLDAGRAQRQAGKQMHAAEREATTDAPRMRPKL